MQMEEVRPVLHAIFRCLLKTLDDGELRDATVGKARENMPGFPHRMFWDHDPRWAVALWTAAQMPDQAHRFSTEVVSNQARLYIAEIVSFSRLIHDFNDENGRFLSGTTGSGQ